MTQPGNALANIVEEYGSGLEDIEDEVTAVPRIGINHSGGTFKDSLSGEEFPSIYGIALGMIKQRVMWEQGDIEAGAKPQCKSQDAKTGYPNMSGKPGDSFPWNEATGLDLATSAVDEHNRPIISCASCPFAEWGAKDAKGKSKPPRCKERYSFPVLYNRQSPESLGLQPYSPPYMDSGIVAFQGSGIAPSKKFLSAFVRSRRPLYSAVIRISLDVNKRGMVEYSVPVFQKLGDVPEDQWEIYARELGPLREFLNKPPRPGDDQDDTKKSGMSESRAAANVGVVNTAPISTSDSPATRVVNGAAQQSNVETVDAEVVASTTSTPAPVASAPDDDEDLPF